MATASCRVLNAAALSAVDIPHRSPLGHPLLGDSACGSLQLGGPFFLAGAMEPSPALPSCFVAKGAFRKNRADRDPSPSSPCLRLRPTRSPSLLLKFSTGTVMNGDD